MKAILVATKGVDGAPVLSERLGAAMLPLLDRPFLQHGVECLVRWGVTEISFVLSHLPEKMETFFGTGERWGCRFRYHLVRDPERPYRAVADALASNRGAPLILADGERLPLAERPDMDAEIPVLLMHEEMSKEKGWTGWAIIPPGLRWEVRKNVDRASLAEALIEAGAVERTVGASLTVTNAADLQAASRKILDMGVPGLMHGAREVEEGIWLSRDVGLHPTARLTPPVYIDEGCRIGKHAAVGPHAVLGNGCMVDEKAIIRDSVVLPLSYIGKGLSLEGAVVDKNCLVNTTLGSELVVTEAFLIGDLADHGLRRRLAGLGSCLLGALLLAAFAPLLLLTLGFLALFRKGPCRPRLEVVALPALPDEAHWRTFPFATFEEGGPDPVSWEARWWHFFLVFLPGLIHVARGRLKLVGLGPRTAEAIGALPTDWRSLYLTGKGGLITEAMLHFGPYPDEDQLYAAEALYTVSPGALYDLKLLLKYAAQLTGIAPRDRECSGARSSPRHIR